MEKRRLGRGLDALLGLDAHDSTQDPSAEVPLDLIQHNPWQPRKTFDPDELASLSASVKSHGILQPLVVRRVGEQYQLIAGERRLRAAQDAGLPSVPVRVVDFNDQQVVEAALIENIQRADLNPIEKAQGFKDYLDRFALNHEQLAQRLGLARSTITNLVNLLELSAEVQEGLRVNQITEAHAKLLKGVKDATKQVGFYRQIVARGLSVKATEELIRGPRANGESEKARRSSGVEKTNHVKSLENDLRHRFGTSVEIRLRGKDQGQVIIDFANNDDFVRIMEMLK